MIVRAFYCDNIIRRESVHITDITKKISDGSDLSIEEITDLFNVPLFSSESFQIQAAAREKSEKACNGLAEVHAQFGMISEARMAHILGVVRLAVGIDVPGHCTHEPSIMAATTGGANLLWAKSGSNPRDTEKDTEGYRGWTVKNCKNVFTESEWSILDGPSKFSLSVAQSCLDNVEK